MEPCEIHLNEQDTRNSGVLNYRQRRNERNLPPCIRPAESPLDPYMHLGSHPDIVERLWVQLAPVFPQDCRCIVYGTPALVAPRSGIVLAVAFGTQYTLRIPEQAVAEAVRLGARTEVTWTTGHQTDLQEEFGKDWVFGRWLKGEPEWCLAVYKSVEDVS